MSQRTTGRTRGGGRRTVGNRLEKIRRFTKSTVGISPKGATVPRHPLVTSLLLSLRPNRLCPPAATSLRPHSLASASGGLPSFTDMHLPRPSAHEREARLRSELVRLFFTSTFSFADHFLSMESPSCSPLRHGSPLSCCLHPPLSRRW